MGNVMSPERFYRKAERSGACLIWQGKGRVGPYGTAGFDGRQWLAHRLSHYFATGETPVVVRHSCDTPLCIEPTHLRGGTHADNVQDKVDRGRQHRGETHPMRKVTPEQVAAIRQAYQPGKIKMQDLADRHGISLSQVSRIIRGDRWKGE